MLTKEMTIDLKIPLPYGKIIEFYDCQCEVHFKFHVGYSSSVIDSGAPNQISIDKVLYDDVNVTEYTDIDFIESQIDANRIHEELKCS